MNGLTMPFPFPDLQELQLSDFMETWEAFQAVKKMESQAIEKAREK